MSWQTTAFERDAIYQEVWTEPVRSVAKRYGISDVGLRKICSKLGVPLPPLGYWAKVAAGKQPRVTPLPKNHKGETRYVRQFRIDDQAEERAARIAALLGSDSAPAVPAPQFRDMADLHPLVKRTGSRLGARRGAHKGAIATEGRDVLYVNVWPEQKDRALRILDAFLCAALASDATLGGGLKEGRQVSLNFNGDAVEVQIEEEVSRAQREPTPAEVARQARESWFQPDLWVRSPTRKLKLTLKGRDVYYPLVTLRDGATPLEERLHDLLPRLLRKLAELRVEQQFRDEENERWRQAEARREAREAQRRAELQRLEKTEKFAEEWHRATRLRAYASALEVAGRGPTAATDDVSMASELAWIRTAADWLDPLVRRHWPEVDGDKAEAVDGG